jgi:hypothetical protein
MKETKELIFKFMKKIKIVKKIIKLENSRIEIKFNMRMK